MSFTSSSVPASCWRWDIFCTVVDNFGDIGICWRLARQLVAEHGQQVRLWVDDLASFQRIAPALDAQLSVQHLRGVEVRLWHTDMLVSAPQEVGEVVVEAFACHIPEHFIAAMAARAPAPLWLNLEYLSAEDWVRGCHGLSSPQPNLALRKFFFFPGFVAGTGGLLRERDLLQRRREFQTDPAALQTFWADLGVAAEASAAALRISLFGYGNDDLADLVAGWERIGLPVLCLVPEGTLAEELAALFGAARARPGDVFRRSGLQVRVLPFLEQDRYDRLLWACDINFVRGEDSFVRAQWAGRPLVWQAYRQEEDTHFTKLEAFLALYCRDMSAGEADALRQMWRAWNREQGGAATWPAFLAHRAALARHAERWAQQMADLGDMTGNLMLFCTNHL